MTGKQLVSITANIFFFQFYIKCNVHFILLSSNYFKKEEIISQVLWQKNQNKSYGSLCYSTLHIIYKYNFIDLISLSN